MHSTQQFEAALCSAMSKQAGFGKVLLTNMFRGGLKMLRGSKNMAADFNLAKRLPGFTQKLDQAGSWAGRHLDEADNWAAGKGKGTRIAMNSLSTVLPIAGLAVPAIAPVFNPIINMAGNLGSVLGQVEGMSTNGRAAAQSGAATYMGGLYDTLNNASYLDRRQMLGNPGAPVSEYGKQFSGLAPAPRMSTAGALWNTLSPWGSGDITPWLQQKATERMLNKQASFVLPAAKALAKGAWRGIKTFATGHGLENASKWVKYPVHIARGATVPLGFGALSYYGGKDNAVNTATQMGAGGAEALTAAYMRNMSPWMRELVAFDPSVAMVAADKKMPGTIKQYEASTGNSFAPGILGSLYNQSGPTQYVVDTPNGPQNL